jgi:hypothetical protein
MAKRKVSAYAKCVGRYLKSHQGNPHSNMRAAAAECKGGSRKRYYPKGRRKGVHR